MEAQALDSKLKELIEGSGSGRAMAQAIVSALVHSHRTHQQSFLGAIKLALYDYSRIDGEDLRNEAAKAWTKEVAKLPNADMGFPYF